MTTLIDGMYGALVAMCLVASMFFIRYWYLTRDRFFLWFAAAFVTFALNWAFVLSEITISEHAEAIFSLRLVGFLLILTAIIQKNRR